MRKRYDVAMASSFFKHQEHDAKMWLTTAEAASLGAEEVAARLHVDVRTGLKWQEADHRRQLTGFNEFTVKEEDPPWMKYIEQVGSGLLFPTYSHLVE